MTDNPGCALGYCNQEAAAVVHSRIGGTLLIRVDQLADTRFAADARCIDHVLTAVEHRITNPLDRETCT